MFGMGYWEMLIVLFVMLLLFGHRLPSMMRSMGRGVTEFKKGLSEVDDEVQQAVNDKSKTDE